MCRHMEGRADGSERQSGQETRREVMDSLSDIAEGLELSAKLRILAEGHWKECDHHGRLPLQGILEDCAHRIDTEARRRRAELEASGSVLFGSVVMEESAESEGSGPGASPPLGGPPVSVSPLHDAIIKLLSVTGSSMKTEPSPAPTWRRIYDAALAGPLRGGPRWSAARTRQGGP